MLTSYQLANFFALQANDIQAFANEHRRLTRQEQEELDICLALERADITGLSHEEVLSHGKAWLALSTLIANNLVLINEAGNYALHYH